MKKALSIFLSLVLVIAALPLAAVESSALTDGDWEYTVSNNEATVTGYTGTLTDIVIPSNLGGLPVKDIGDRALECCGLTSVIIPDSVTDLGLGVFNGCTSLTSVIIPDSVTSIGDAAFHGCSSLSSITIPDSVINIGDLSFAECSSLSSIKISDSVTSIGYQAFYGCGLLSSVIIPDSVTSIGRGAFYNCSSLSDVVIGRNLTSISHYAFFYCTSLTDIIIPENVTSIGEYAFFGCSLLSGVTIYNKDAVIDNTAFISCDQGLTIYGNSNSTAADLATAKHYSFVPLENLFTYYISDGETTVTGYNGQATDLGIPSTLGGYPVTTIETGAFTNCTSLSRVLISDSVTSIGDVAFYGCSSLSSIIIPDSVINIGDRSFAECASLSNVTIGNHVTNIGDNAFYGCGSLTNITIPDNVKSIGKHAFRGCSLLSSVTIGNGVTGIGDFAFYNCASLSSVTIGNHVTSIGEAAFYGCALTNITIPDSVINIGDRSFAECASLSNVTIGNHVTNIGDNAFYGCGSLTNITIPDNVKSIGKHAFRGCALTRVIIPGSVTDIGDFAFYNCASLSKVFIPSSVIDIGTAAFLNCSSSLVIYGCVGTSAYNYASSYGVSFFAGAFVTVNTVVDGHVANIDKYWSLTDSQYPPSYYLDGSWIFVRGSHGIEPPNYTLNLFVNNPDGYGCDGTVINGSSVTSFSDTQGQLTITPEGAVTINLHFYSRQNYTTLYFQSVVSSDFYSRKYLKTENQFTFPECPFSYSVYLFNGWNTSSDGNGNSFSENEIVALPTADTTYYAHWMRDYDINEDGDEDIDDIGFILSVSVGSITNATSEQLAKADLNNDGVVDAFDAAELDRYVYSVNTAKGDVNQDGNTDLADYAMTKAHISGVAVDNNTPANLLDKSYLTAEYDGIKDNYPNGTIITQQYYCADYDGDKAVDAFDLFYIDKRINNIA